MSIVTDYCCQPSSPQFLPAFVCFWLRACASARFEASNIVQEYILPRYSENRAGRVKGQDENLTGEDDVLRMNSVRFAVGEVLFRPSDIGL